MPKYNFCITRLFGLIATVVFFLGMVPLMQLRWFALINTLSAIMITMGPFLLLMTFETSKFPKFFLACIISIAATPAEPDSDIEHLARAGKWIVLTVGIMNFIFAVIHVLLNLNDNTRTAHGVAVAMTGLLYATVIMLFMYLIQFSHRSKA